MSHPGNEGIGVGGCIVFLIALYFALEFWREFLSILALAITGFIAFKIYKKKRKQAKENWIPNNIHKIEPKIKEKLKLAASYEKALIENEHYRAGVPSAEPRVYHTLEERKAYLETVEEKLVETFNRLVLPKFPYLAPAKNLWDIQYNSSHFNDLFYSLWSGFKRASNEDIGKKAEIELFEKYGVHPLFAVEVADYVQPRFSQFINNITELDDSKNVIKIEQKIINSGLAGEKRLKEELDLYSDVLTTLYNVRIETEGSSVESDAIVASTKGIYTIEAKNFSSSGSYSIRITKDGQWLKVWPNGHMEPMKDVVSQTNRHVALKQRFINNVLREKGISTDYVYIKFIIVIANDNVMIDNESDIPVIRASQVYNYIQKQPDVLPKEVVSEIIEIFKEHTLEAKSFPYRAYEKELEEWLNFVIPAAEYCSRAGLAHKAFIDQVVAYNNDLPTQLLYYGYDDLSYPVTADSEIAAKFENTLTM